MILQIAETKVSREGLVNFWDCTHHAEREAELHGHGVGWLKELAEIGGG